MKSLNGRELAGFIKERQLRQVRSIKQGLGIDPKLAIVSTNSDPASEIYVRLKQSYGADLGVTVKIYKVEQVKAKALIEQLNSDSSVQGIILQLPLDDPTDTDSLLALIDPNKDVDGLGPNAVHDPATPLAITWLLAGYNIELNNKNIIIVGRGRLVGAPLEKLLLDSGLKPAVLDINTKDIAAKLQEADIVITATGQPGLIKPNMLKSGAVVVDAGVAVEDGKAKGDLDNEVYSRQDLILTPQKGGVGPLTVAALFENLIAACRSLV